MLSRGGALFVGSVTLALAAIGNAAWAADLPLPDPEPLPPAPSDLPLPAVSGVNGKFAVFGGGLDSGGNDGEMIGGQGSLSVPISQRFGFQGDAFGFVAADDYVAGGAGHLFWRDPSIGLLGVYGGACAQRPPGFLFRQSRH